MSGDDHEAEVQDFIAQNHDLLSRVLARGNRDAQGYALALLSHGGTPTDIDEIQQRLDELKDETRE